MSRLRGNHTSLIPLAEEVIDILKKKDKIFTYSPGIIIRKNIKVKDLSIKIVEDSGSLLVTLLMKNSKQLVRFYNMSKTDLEKYITSYCAERQIQIK